MCDFKVGDEVVCITDELANWGVLQGPVYVISQVLPPLRKDGLAGIRLQGLPAHDIPENVGYRVDCFRKVQRRNSRLTLEAFFTVPGGFEEPKRAPVKTPERV